MMSCKIQIRDISLLVVGMVNFNGDTAEYALDKDFPLTFFFGEKIKRPKKCQILEHFSG